MSKGYCTAQTKASVQSLLRAVLTPLAGSHQLVVRSLSSAVQYVGVRKRYRLPIPVIAIGNLSSGGTGKTPMAALVAGHLKADGKRVVLLSRGHGGSGETGHTPRIVSDGETVFLSPEEAGDEPVLLARLLPGVPVIVGRDRRRSGKLAVERFAPDIIVLDDALQYWQLHRDLNIVLLDARRPFDNGYVLPRGLLREPPSHLSRAGIVVLTRADRVSPDELSATKARVQGLAPHAAVFAASHAPLGWRRASDNAELPLDTLVGQNVFAFSGIADGAGFFQTVISQGATVAASRAFGDHFAYDAAVVRELADQAAQSGWRLLSQPRKIWSRSRRCGPPPLCRSTPSASA